MIGASTGGVRALLDVVSRLPADLAAAVFVVLHEHPLHQSRLPQLLASRGTLQASHALHGDTIVPGHIYVAPPDNHLMLGRGVVRVLRGPKESGHRPAVDALFRTAAASYGPRVIGIILTGQLDCGTAGMLSIKARGGVGIVQNPHEAEARSMPQSALDHATIDHVATLEELPALITRLVSEPAGEAPAGQVSPALMRFEGKERGTPAMFVCPECQGTVSEASLGDFTVFRCHTGHSFTLESIDTEQANEVERALWAAVRALEEGATMSKRLASTAAGDLREKFIEKAHAQARNAKVVRDLILGGLATEKTQETDDDRTR
ncbi:chemotaxis protein CheB [Pendulispora brunnea]|uniref:protein-glutamate methylesterase n=1 Tax=Pendulispora brunnea TaxID=2905690 RepID=A0ABZ2KD11_9BACT